MTNFDFGVRFAKFRDFCAAPMTEKSFRRQLFCLLSAAVILRIALAIPALLEPETLFRPDSGGYWNPAKALAAGEGFVSAPGSQTPEAVRPPGYPLFLALGIRLWGERLFPAALAGILLGASGLLPIVLVLKKFKLPRAGLLAGWLFALHPTAISVSPLFLSDNLLSVIAGWQLFFGAEYFRNRKFKDFALCSIMVILGCYVKPVNLPVLFIGLPVIALACASSWKTLLRDWGTALALTLILIGPFFLRNIRLCGDLDGNTANAYFHNGSAILAHATGLSSEMWRDFLLVNAEAAYRAEPERYATLKAQNAWKKREFRLLMQKHPLSAICTHLPQLANLIPDGPTLLENNHVTATGQGTMAVLRQEGVISAVRHYLHGRWHILLFLLPLLAVHFAVLLLAACRFVFWVRNNCWRELLLFGVFVFYYWWAPGPVISPRYLLPALPMLLVMAGTFLSGISAVCISGKKNVYCAENKFSKK